MRVFIQPGFGDSLYSRPIIKELSKAGEVSVISKYPEAFSGLNVSMADGAKHDIHLRFEAYKMPNAFEQMAKCANIPVPDFDYSDLQFPESSLVNKIKSQAARKSKKLLVVHEPHIAERHRKAKDERDAANAQEMSEWLLPYAGTHEIITIGQDDMFTGRVRADIRTENCLQKTDLLHLALEADIIATQIGVLVVMACMYRKKLKMFKAIGDDEKKFDLRRRCVIVPNTAEVIL